jgi:AAA+ ATPase superfamily predicted ATPase
MGMLIGREQENKIPKNALSSGSSELIAVYGRRRIGKTLLTKRP